MAEKKSRHKSTVACRTRGQPVKFTGNDLDAATTMLVNLDITVSDIADRLNGVARDALSLLVRRADGVRLTALISRSFFGCSGLAVFVVYWSHELHVTR